MLSLLGRRLLSRQTSAFSQDIRTFLSNSYKCQDAWEQRKRAPIFQKIDYDDLYHQLDRSFQIGLRISVLDVDLFVNGLDNEGYQSELEDVLFKLRLNPEAGLLSQRTMHAVARFYIDNGKKTELINILNNRLNYGIFPDYYVSNLLMDAFLKDGDNPSAAKVAVLQMLQEDFGHPILHPLSIYSCYKYLNSSEIWAAPKEPEVDPDEDEVKVRVGFIRNPYFDDHFDLVNTNHLVGKTLRMAGATYPGPLGPSSQLVGLALHEKRASIKDLLKQLVTNKTPIYEDAFKKAMEYTKVTPKQPEGEKPPEESPEVAAEKADLILTLEKAQKGANLVPGDVEAIAAADVAKAVNENESKDIASLAKTYKSWEKEREDHIQQEIFESKKRKIVEEIAKTKEDLSKQEEMIFFFDKEDQWELKVEQKEEEIKALAEQQKTVKRKSSEEDYIPPEVGQKRF